MKETTPLLDWRGQKRRVVPTHVRAGACEVRVAAPRGDREWRAAPETEPLRRPRCDEAALLPDTGSTLTARLVRTLSLHVAGSRDI